MHSVLCVSSASSEVSVKLPRGPQSSGLARLPVEGTGREKERKAHLSHLLTALPDLRSASSHGNGKMCFFEIILKTERGENEWWPGAPEGEV